jgi:hypothetical protein
LSISFLKFIELTIIESAFFKKKPKKACFIKFFDHPWGAELDLVIILILNIFATIIAYILA